MHQQWCLPSFLLPSGRDCVHTAFFCFFFARALSFQCYLSRQVDTRTHHPCMFSSLPCNSLSKNMWTRLCDFLSTSLFSPSLAAMKRSRTSFQTPFKTAFPVSSQDNNSHTEKNTSDAMCPAGSAAPPVHGPARTVSPKASDAELVEDILYWLDVSQRAAEVLAQEMNQPVDAILEALHVAPSAILYQDGEFCRC